MILRQYFFLFSSSFASLELLKISSDDYILSSPLPNDLGSCFRTDGMEDGWNRYWYILVRWSVY